MRVTNGADVSVSETITVLVAGSYLAIIYLLSNTLLNIVCR